MDAHRVDALVGLIDASRWIGPGDVARVVHEHAKRAGAHESTIHLADLHQATLMPLGPPGERHDIDGSMPGLAYRSTEPVDVGRNDRHHLWLPLIDGTARLGVLGLVLDEADHETMEWARAFAEVVTLLVISRDRYGDTMARTRRAKQVDLATELRYAMLPPTSFSTAAFDLAAALEPAYQVAGDGFDFAYDHPSLHVSITDAVGHGLRASQVSNLATAALRHARFWDLGLPDAYRTAGEAVQQEFSAESFVTAQLATLDVDHGTVELVNAGHPQPLLLRGKRFPITLECPPAPPIGIAPDTRVEVTTLGLEPGDLLLFFTDGVVEARSPDGRRFGLERLVDFFTRSAASDEPSVELLRRLVRQILTHADNPLDDDACLVLVEWRGPH